MEQPGKQDLEEELRRYRGFFVGGPVVVFRWVAAPGWPVEYVSPNVQHLFGVSAEDFLSGSKPYAEVVHPDDLARVAQEVAEKSLPGVRGFDQEYRIVRPDGAERWLFDHTLIVRNAAGEITHFEGYVFDQTEVLRARNERERIQRELLETQKLESLGVLAGGIAHDFNNLLTGILGNAELALLELPPGHPARDSIQRAIGISKHAASLAGELLAYSGRTHFAPSVIDVGELVRDLAHLFTSSLPKKVHLELAIAEGCGRVEADPSQIRQVLMNLVLNAAEAYEGRAGTVVMSIRPSSRGQDWLTIEVADRGQGMSPENVTRIFEPFFTTKSQGRGLGLSAVLGILRAHKGRIDVTSELGQGTCVRVDLPTTTSHVVPEKETAPVSAAAGEMVLVVDDEPPVLDLARRFLERSGYRVLTAADGLAAIELFGAHAGEIDAVLVDLTMPEMGGIEAMQGMRAIQPDVGFVLTSGFPKDESASRLSSLPPHAFLQKPYALDSLARALQQVMPRRARSRA